MLLHNKQNQKQLKTDYSSEVQYWNERVHTSTVSTDNNCDSSIKKRAFTCAITLYTKIQA